MFSAKANMAYWGPADGHVAGRNTDGKLRVLHELITVDMRNLPFGETHVQADYLIESQKDAGYMVFLFVADAENPVELTVILDGVTQTWSFSDSGIINIKQFGFAHNIPADSLSEIIGLELEKDAYNNQRIFPQLYTFKLFIIPGQHRLKIAYDLIPTAWEKGDLRYYSFSYYLGNKYTRALYDSIDLIVQYPKGLAWESNVNCIAKNRNLYCHNLAGFKGSHLSISFYKHIQHQINRGRTWLDVAHISLWVLTGFLTIFLFKRRFKKNKKIGFHWLWVIPIAITLGILYFTFTEFFFNYFERMHDPWLRGSFGKGYHFLAVPIVAIVSGICWLLLAFMYQWWFYYKLSKQNVHSI